MVCTGLPTLPHGKDRGFHGTLLWGMARLSRDYGRACSFRLGPDLFVCPWGMGDSSHWRSPHFANLPGVQIPRHTGLWRCTRCSAAPSSWLHKAWAQSGNLSQRFCRLPEQGLQSNPAYSGPAQWSVPAGTFWLWIKGRFTSSLPTLRRDHTQLEAWHWSASPYGWPWD